MKIDHVTISSYDTAEQAEHAVNALREGCVDLTAVSVAGKNAATKGRVTAYYDVGERMIYWGEEGAIWGGLWGLLFGAALFAVPGIGPILVAGPLVGCIVAGLESAVVGGGVSALGAGLLNIGIPKDSLLEYENALQSSRILVIVHGTEKIVAKARAILLHTPSSVSRSGGERLAIS